MFRVHAPAAGRRAGVIALTVIAGVLAARASFAQQPPAQAAPAKNPYVFASDGALLLQFIKADKAADALLAPLLPLCRGLYCTTPPGVTGVPPEALVAAAAALGVPAQVFAEPRAALAAARDARRGDELVVVAGSLFLVAAVRAMLSSQTGVA